MLPNRSQVTSPLTKETLQIAKLKRLIAVSAEDISEAQKFTFKFVLGNLIPFHNLTEAEQESFRALHPNMVSLDADKFCSPLYDREQVDYWRQKMAEHVLWRRAHLRRSGFLDESDWSHAATKHGAPPHYAFNSWRSNLKNLRITNERLLNPRLQRAHNRNT